VPTFPPPAPLDLSCSPPEASRAIRKKIKHGNTHQQYRALVVRSPLGYNNFHILTELQIFNALVENCGPKFHSTVFLCLSACQCLRSYIGSFADGQLTDALKHLATDYSTDPKVRKKVLAVLASLSRQFKDDPSAAGIAGLYQQVKPTGSSSRSSEANREALAERERESERRRREKEEAKRKAKETRGKKKAAASRSAAASRRQQFNFENVCFSVALASSC